MASRPDQIYASFMLERELVEPKKWRLTIEARREKAKALAETGMSQRKIAEVLGVDKRTIGRDLAQDAPESGAKRPTDHRDTRRKAAILSNEAVAVSAQVRPLVDEGGVVRKLSMVAACKALLLAIKTDRAVAAALGRARHMRVS
jgi:IS30 family transposase